MSYVACDESCWSLNLFPRYSRWPAEGPSELPRPPDEEGGMEGLLILLVGKDTMVEPFTLVQSELSVLREPVTLLVYWLSGSREG